MHPGSMTFDVGIDRENTSGTELSTLKSMKGE
jgi:hypothetical protein